MTMMMMMMMMMMMIMMMNKNKKNKKTKNKKNKKKELVSFLLSYPLFPFFLPLFFFFLFSSSSSFLLLLLPPPLFFFFFLFSSSFSSSFLPFFFFFLSSSSFVLTRTQVYGYESGPGTFGGNSIPGKMAANEAPEMQGMVERMYTLWHQYGFSTLNYFHAGAQDYNWPFGQWALQTSMHQPDTPKTRALDAVRAMPIPAVSVGVQVPVTNYNSSLYVGFYEKDPAHPPAANISYIEQGSSFMYLLRAPQAGKLSLHLRLATHNMTFTGCALNVTFNAPHVPMTTKVVPVAPTASTHDYQPAAAISLGIPAGLSVLQLSPWARGSPCAVTGANNRTTLSMAIGTFDVL